MPLFENLPDSPLPPLKLLDDAEKSIAVVSTETLEFTSRLIEKKLLDFATHSDSGMMPGAAPMLAAGAAVQGGVTAGMVVANTAISGTKTYNSDVARMAAASGDQVVRYLSEFFAQQGWIRSDQVRKARIAY